MSRSAQNLKGLFAPRPPRYPPALPPPPQFEAFTTASSFLLRKATATLFSFLRRLFSKALRFFSLSMDSFPFSLSSPRSFNLDDDVCTYDSSSSSPSVEPLYLVPLRWWNDAKAAVNAGGGGKIGGVLYNVTSSLSNKKLEKDDSYSEVESEIVLEMRRAGETETSTSEGQGVSGSGDLHLALLSEWMFLKAFKW